LEFFPPLPQISVKVVMMLGITLDSARFNSAKRGHRLPSTASLLSQSHTIKIANPKQFIKPSLCMNMRWVWALYMHGWSNNLGFVHDYEIANPKQFIKPSLCMDVRWVWALYMIMKNDRCKSPCHINQKI
jgi:hypothetical protein